MGGNNCGDNIQRLTLFINLLAFSDGEPTNNPQLRDFDYARRLPDVPTAKTQTVKKVVGPQVTENLMSVQRTLTSGASWTVTNPSGVTSQLTWSGVNPLLRTERTGSALSGSSTCAVVRLGQSVVQLQFSASPGTGIIAGDEIYLGPTSGFSIQNQGIFTVVGVSGNNVDVLSTTMVNENDTTSDPTAIYAFSAGPVRVGDFVNIMNVAFNFGNRGEYPITMVTSRFIQVQNQNLVPEGPITADFVVYDVVFNFTYIETDQQVSVFINGSSTPVIVTPIQAGQPGLVGVILWRGPVYSISVQNSGYNSATVTTFLAA